LFFVFLRPTKVGGAMPGFNERYQLSLRAKKNHRMNRWTRFYEYTLDWSKGSKRHHLDGERTFIERYVRLDEFDVLFGARCS